MASLTEALPADSVAYLEQLGPGGLSAAIRHFAVAGRFFHIEQEEGDQEIDFRLCQGCRPIAGITIQYRDISASLTGLIIYDEHYSVEQITALLTEALVIAVNRRNKVFLRKLTDESEQNLTRAMELLGAETKDQYQSIDLTRKRWPVSLLISGREKADRLLGELKCDTPDDRHITVNTIGYYLGPREDCWLCHSGNTVDNIAQRVSVLTVYTGTGRSFCMDINYNWKRILDVEWSIREEWDQGLYCHLIDRIMLYAFKNQVEQIDCIGGDYRNLPADVVETLETYGFQYLRIQKVLRLKLGVQHPIKSVTSETII